MIPAAFDYVRPTSIEEAVAALDRYGDDAKLLAGGHSLLPLMKLRLATPGVLIDIGRLHDLAHVREDGGELRIGALARHCDLESSALLAEAAPLLAHVAGLVGDPQVRHRGTLGGAIAHGDPGSDLAAALLALRATVVAVGPAGERTIDIDGFFTGYLQTAVAPDEVLTEIRVPSSAGAGWSFQKFGRRPQHWATVAVAAVLGDAPGIGLVKMASSPVRAAGAEAALLAGASAADAAARVDEGLDPPADLEATAAYRRHLARVLTRRALAEAGA